MIEKRTYRDGGINWNWYIEGNFNEEKKTVEVLRYYRVHKGEDGDIVEKGEATLNSLIGSRVADTVNTDKDGTYKVSNPRNVFEYN